MKLKDIIKIASDAYSDGLIEQYFNTPSGDFGDSLAKFIAMEIKDTYDPAATDNKQLFEAYRVIESIKRQVANVAAVLFSKCMGLT